MAKQFPKLRVRLNEVSPSRVVEALKRRLDDMSEKRAWGGLELATRSRARLEQYRDLHKGERCFVIANGPSVAKMGLWCLRDEYTMCMNRAYLMFETWGFQPNYYVCINDLVLEQFADDILRLEMPKFLNFHSRDLFDKALDDESMIFLRLGLYLKDWFSSDLTHAIASGGTVTFVCLQLAYFMGFDEVILVGLDHSFVEKGVPNTAVLRNAERDEDHCHPDYFPKGVKWELPDLYRSELAYRLARRSFESDGRQIVDATVGGKCGVFEKAVFENVVTSSSVT